MKLIVLVGCLCFAASNVLAQKDIEGKGECPKVNYLKNFNPDDFLGDWYETKRYENSLTTGKCVKAKYEITGTATKFTADYHQTIEKNKTNDFKITLKKRPATDAAMYDVYLNEEEKAQKLGHNIVATDYKKYALIYSCSYQSEKDIHTHKLSVLIRKKELDEDTNKLIKADLEREKLNQELLKDVEQDEKKCNSATNIAASTLLNGIIIMVLTRKLI